MRSILFSTSFMLLAVTSAFLATPAAAQALAPMDPTPRVQTVAEAFARDAEEYALRNGVDPAEATRRLRAQEESVPETDRIARLYADRLAGIAIEHHPAFRIVVLLTGDAPVPARTIRAGGMEVAIVVRTGAWATRVRIGQAITEHRAAIRSVLPAAQGMGVDMRTGELVVLVREMRDIGDEVAARAELETLTGVPVRVRAIDQRDADMSVDGGARMDGSDPRDGRRYACTTGFVVTDEARVGIVTAAHCPDALTVTDAAGRRTPLEFVGQWGVAYQDVQLHVGDFAGSPLFQADASLRPLTSARSRTSTRAGESVCHRGVSSGYSCSVVDLVDYAPPGDLCAGPCDPVWTTVAGPSCRGGDSGGPIFNGTVAFGIAKGGSYGRDGRCGFYFYMSTDYLPAGWKLLLDGVPGVSGANLG